MSKDCMNAFSGGLPPKGPSHGGGVLLLSILNVIPSETCIHNKRCTHTNMYYTIYVCTYTLLVDSKDPQL